MANTPHITSNHLLVRLMPIIDSTINAMGATYLAVILGIASTLGDAKDYPDLRSLMHKLAIPLLIGVIVTIVASGSCRAYFSEREYAEKVRSSFFPLNKVNRKALYTAFIFSVASLIFLLVVLLMFSIFLLTV